MASPSVSFYPAFGAAGVPLGTQLSSYGPPPHAYHPTRALRVSRRHYTPGVDGPTNHIRVPQLLHDDGNIDYASLRDPIRFFREGFPEPGLKLEDIDRSDPVLLFNHADRVLSSVPEKAINVWIKWPGYPARRKRVSTLSGSITREALLSSLCKAVLEWTVEVFRDHPINQTHPEFAIVGRIRPRSMIFITELVHRGSSNWQVELWMPHHSLIFG
ncbi:hypothetical protein MD484_g8876, partial [Candolleomyces efflorescens]